MELIIDLSLKSLIEYKKSFNSVKFEFINKTIFVVSSKNCESTYYKGKISEISSSTNLNFLESLFPSGYFIILIEDNEVFVFRNLSGLNTGYFKIESSKLYISTNSHKIAHITSSNSLNKNIVGQLLFSEFLMEGYTLYNNIYEFNIGCKNIYDFKDNSFKIIDQIFFDFADSDNKLSFYENKILLRDHIIKSHEHCLGDNNVVYLSGGIDSCVMLGALNHLLPSGSVNPVSFKVKGTKEDETFYAEKAAKYLGYKLDIFEFDPHDKTLFSEFEEDILNFNNPYVGILNFRPPVYKGAHFFGGQDTRLHTPDINSLTKYAFNVILKNGNVKTTKKSFISNFLLELFYKSELPYSSNIFLRNFDHVITFLFSKNDYLKTVLLNNNVLKSLKYNLPDFNNLYRDEILGINSNIVSERHLYNLIIERKWKEQYVNDIRYMVDLGSSVGGFMQMPFYNLELSRFSSSVPFNYGAMYSKGIDKFSKNEVKVNKILLREAFKEDISPDVLFRKKAVSLTLDLIFGGHLGVIIMDKIKTDISSSDSLIKEFQYFDFVRPFLLGKKKYITNQRYLLRIYYLYTILVYKNNL